MKGILALFQALKTVRASNDRGLVSNVVRLVALTGVIGLSLSINILPANAQNKMPRGSFLKYPVHSTPELLDQIKQEPLVAARFARLFNMSPDMIRIAFSKLRLVKLGEPMKRRIYYVHQYEALGYKMRKIGVGTMIFAYPDGTPVLMQICGNPLRTPPFGYGKPGLGQPVIPDYSDRTDNPVATSSNDTRSPKMRNEAPSSQVESFAMDSPIEDFILSEDVVPVDQPVPAFHRGASGAGLSVTAINQILGWIAGIGATAGLFAAGGGESSVTSSTNGDSNGGSASSGGNNGSTTTTTGGGSTTNTGGNTNTGTVGTGDTGGTTTGGTSTSSDVVPESDSLLLFLFGGGAIMIAAYARKRFTPQLKV